MITELVHFLIFLIPWGSKVFPSLCFLLSLDCWIIEAFLSSLLIQCQVKVIEFVLCLSESASHTLSRCPDVLHGKLSVWL